MSVVALADAKTHLNEQSTANDAEIQTFIDTAEAAVAAKIGALTVVSIPSEQVRGCGYWLRLSKFPVASLTSVTPVGSGATPLDITTLTVSPDALRLVEFTFGGWFGARWYTVAYTAGRAVSTSTFPDIYKGILELVRHLWMTQRGSAAAGARYSGHGTALDTMNAATPGAAYLWPARVLQILEPYMPLGVA